MKIVGMKKIPIINAFCLYFTPFNELEVVYGIRSYHPFKAGSYL